MKRKLYLVIGFCSIFVLSSCQALLDEWRENQEEQQQEKLDMKYFYENYSGKYYAVFSIGEKETMLNITVDKESGITLILSSDSYREKLDAYRNGARGFGGSSQSLQITITGNFQNESGYYNQGQWKGQFKLQTGN